MNTKSVGYGHSIECITLCQDMKNFTAKLTKRQEIAPTIFELELELTEPRSIDFLSGQFVNIRVPKGDTFVRRSYSIASPVTEKNKLILCLKFLPEGNASHFFAKATIGDEVQFDGPHGFFTMRDKHVPIRMIAAGTGITPFMSMLPELDASDVQLFFGVRREKDIFWKEKLDQFTASYSHVAYTITLSQPSTSWRGARGRVTAHIADILNTNPETHYYICGSPPMVIEMRKLLIDNGIDMKKIFFELFT